MKRRNKAEWKALIAEHNKSGERLADWCKTKGINPNTFQNKRRLLAKTEGYKEAKQTTELRQNIKWVMAVDSEEKAPEKAREGLEVRIGGFSIQAYEGFSEATFMRVCSVLKEL